MELREFVAETLQQVAQGVSDAKAVCHEDADINPGVVGRLATAAATDTLLYNKQSGALVQYIDFDVAVTETKGTQTKASIGVLFANIGAGAKGSSEAVNRTDNRVKFSVPISFIVSSADAKTFKQSRVPYSASQLQQQRRANA